MNCLSYSLWQSGGAHPEHLIKEYGVHLTLCRIIILLINGITAVSPNLQNHHMTLSKKRGMFMNKSQAGMLVVTGDGR